LPFQGIDINWMMIDGTPYQAAAFHPPKEIQTGPAVTLLKKKKY
jgi:hypothetical protein